MGNYSHVLTDQHLLCNLRVLREQFAVYHNGMKVILILLRHKRETLTCFSYMKELCEAALQNIVLT